MAETLAIVALGLGAANTLIGSSSQARAQKLESQFKSQQLQTNAKLAEIQAKDAEIRGKREEEEHKIRVRKLIGDQRANLAAQGIDIGSGSALDVQLDAAEFGALDALTIRNNAFKEATGFRVQSIDLSSQARFESLAGKNRARNTLITGGLRAVTGLAAGGAKLKEVS